MKKLQKAPLSAASAWRVEFVRLIAFPASPAAILDESWWSDLAGARPADYISTRRKDLRDERGSFQGALLSLTVDFRRVIWEARPTAIVDRSGNFPTFEEPLREKFHWFVAILDSWLTTSCPPLRRLAFSAKLLQPAITAREAYEVLAAHLPVVCLDPPPNDFLLQLNRRKESSDVEGLSINRVSTWSRMNVAIEIEPGKSFKWPERCYSALELDINTAPERGGLLPRESLPRLFGELVSLGIDIAERGDSP